MNFKFGTGNAERGIQNSEFRIRNSELAFTMVEIAISLGVIAFALVAIIGVLPMGMGIQRENREDTLINQDGPYFLEAIRNGAQGLDHLTNHVEWIQIATTNDTGGSIALFTNPNQAFSSHPLPQPPPGPPGPQPLLTTGKSIIGLLTMPKFFFNGIVTNTNRVTALVHSLTGSAVEQGTNAADFGFTYLLTTEIMPYSFVPEDSTNYTAYTNVAPVDSWQWITRSNRWLEVLKISTGLTDTNAALYEVKLTCRWPVLANLQPGPRRQTFRTLVSSRMTNDLSAIPPNPPIWLFDPQKFEKIQ